VKVNNDANDDASNYVVVNDDVGNSVCASNDVNDG